MKIQFYTDWNTLVVGKLSPYINVDSKSRTVARNSEETLLQELALANHLGLCAVTFKLNGNIEKNMNLARIICNKVAATLHYPVGTLNLVTFYNTHHFSEEN